MNPKHRLVLDEIGYWSEIKLDIVSKYGKAYSTILASRKNPEFYHVYIDAFAGAGTHISRETGKPVPGSPINALDIDPPFCEYYFSDIDRNRLDALRQTVGRRSNVHFFEGDCNDILIKEVFPKVQWEDYRRGLCLLDPYGLHLNWEVIKTAGEMKTIDMFLNFPVADMNRNVFWRNPEGVDPADIERMNSFWGDGSWKEIAYSTNGNLFGYPEKEDNETIAEGFRERLQKVAGFAHSPVPLPMRNSKGSIVYYLFFASQQPLASQILEDIFRKYREY